MPVLMVYSFLKIRKMKNVWIKFASKKTSRNESVLFLQ